MTTTHPIIGPGQNGPGTADVESTFYNQIRQPIWTLDGDGHVNYVAYDPATGGVIQTIQDVDYSRLTADQQVSFDQTGWTRPSGGLNLRTTMQVDGLGRTIEETDPNGNITWTIFNDAAHEVRTYRGWDPAAHTATGPIEISREYRPTAGAPAGEQAVYEEALTSGATPTYDPATGAPTGQETIDASNIQGLSRDITNDAGQAVESDQYFLRQAGRRQQRQRHGELRGDRLHLRSARPPESRRQPGRHHHPHPLRWPGARRQRLGRHRRQRRDQRQPGRLGRAQQHDQGRGL